MADLCQQCTQEIFGVDWDNDLYGLCGPDEIVRVLCEGCGWTDVNEEGVCVNPECPRHGDDPVEEEEVY